MARPPESPTMVVKDNGYHDDETTKQSHISIIVSYYLKEEEGNIFFDRGHLNIHMLTHTNDSLVKYVTINFQSEVI